MHRFAKPCRCSPYRGCAYRRRRKRSSGITLIVLIVFILIAVCVMPLWLLCVILGVIAGFLVCLLLAARR